MAATTSAQLLLSLLTEEDGTLTREFQMGLEVKLREALAFSVTFVLEALAAPVGGPAQDPHTAYQLCKFLVAVTEFEELQGLLQPADASKVAQNVARTHPGSEDVQNCARWLWWLVSPARLMPDIQAAVGGSDNVLPVRAALWAIPTLTRRQRLPNPQEFLPWVLRAMAGTFVSDEQVQLYGCASLLALCSSRSFNVQAYSNDIAATLEHALAVHVGHWEVIEKLLEASAWTLRLSGHVRFLSNPVIRSYPALLKCLLCDLGLRKRLVYHAEEVGFPALQAVMDAAASSNADMSHPKMCALWGLLEMVSELGIESEPLLLQGAQIVVQALAESSLCQYGPEREFVQAAFSVVLVLARFHSLAVTSLLREHREVLESLLEITLEPWSLRHHELVTCCRLIAALWSISDLIAFVEKHNADAAPQVRVNLLQAACCAIKDGAYEAEELKPCAAAIMRMALDFLETTTVQEGSGGNALSAPAGTLGVAIAHLDGKDSASQAIIRRALQRLLELTKFAHDLAAAGYHLLHNTLWAMREAVTYSEFARGWVASQAQALEFLFHAMQSLVDDSHGRAPADEGGDARQALTEGLSTLTLLSGASCVVLAMGRLPGSRAVQAAGCAALRDAAQRGLLDPKCQEAKAALRQACTICENEPEVETAACMALGLLGE